MLRKLCQQGIDVLKFRESICHPVSIDKEPVKVNACAQSKRNHFTLEWIWKTNKQTVLPQFKFSKNSHIQPWAGHVTCLQYCWVTFMVNGATSDAYTSDTTAPS